MSINDHDSVQKQSLFMDIDIWISYNIHVSGNIFLFDFFPPVIKICSDHQKLWLGKNMQVWPMGCNRIVSKIPLGILHAAVSFMALSHGWLVSVSPE